MGLTLLCFYFFGIGEMPLTNVSGTYLRVTGIKELKGQLMIAIYDKASDFPKHDRGVYTIVKKVNSKTMKMDLSPYLTLDKKYAIAVYHDINENNKLDINIFGAPTESYGFSNHARGFFSAPDFSEASFFAKNNKLIEITIK